MVLTRCLLVLNTWGRGTARRPASLNWRGRGRPLRLWTPKEKETLLCPSPLYLRNGAVSLGTPASAPRLLWALGEEEAGGLSFRPEEVYVFQSTGGSGLWDRRIVIVGWGCEGPSCTRTSCCTGGVGDFWKLPVLCATNTAPKIEKRRKGLNSC